MPPPRVALVGPFPPIRSGIADQDARLLAALERLGVDVVSIGFRRMYPSFLYPGISERGEEKRERERGKEKEKDFLEGEESGAGAERVVRIDAQPVSVHAAGPSRAAPLARRGPFEGISSSSSSSSSPSSFSPDLLDGLNPLSFVRAARLLSSQKISLLLLPWWTAYFAPHAALLLSVLGAESAATVRLLVCHNVFDHEGSPVKAALTRAVLRRADRFAAQNRSSADQVLSERPDAPVAVVPHPVEPRAVLPDREEARALLGLPSDAPVFLFSGLLRPYKGWDVLLDAFAALRREVPSAVLVLAGEPWGEARRLEAWAPAGVRLELRYLPEDERARWFAACDAVVCPYRHATGSGIAADALAHGRPVVGTDVPGLTDVVVDGQTGLLVPPGDAGALAGALVRFVREGLAPRLAAGAAHRRSAFGPEAHARSLLSLGGLSL